MSYWSERLQMSILRQVVRGRPAWLRFTPILSNSPAYRRANIFLGRNSPKSFASIFWIKTLWFRTHCGSIVTSKFWWVWDKFLEMKKDQMSMPCLIKIYQNQSKDSLRYWLWEDSQCTRHCLLTWKNTHHLWSVGTMDTSQSCRK